MSHDQYNSQDTFSSTQNQEEISAADFFQLFSAYDNDVKDNIIIRKEYVDMTGSLNAGSLLSYIVFWTKPKNGRPKLQVEKEGHLWLAKERDEWWEEIRLSEKEYRLAIGVLIGLDLVVKKVFMFNSKSTTHLRLNVGKFMELFEAQHPELSKLKMKLRNGPKGQSGLAQKAEAITEYTNRVSSSLQSEDIEPHVSVPSQKDRKKIEPYFSPHILEEDKAKGLGAVRITKEEYAKLIETYSKEQIIQKSNELSLYVVSHPKKYTNHYYTLREWLERPSLDGKSTSTQLDLKAQNKAHAEAMQAKYWELLKGINTRMQIDEHFVKIYRNKPSWSQEIKYTDNGFVQQLESALRKVDVIL